MNLNSNIRLNEETQTRESYTLDEIIDGEYSLFLYNDDEISFDYVISQIIKICNFSIQQAEQLAMLAHNNGKARITRGEKEKLQPLNREFGQKGIPTEIK